MILTVTAKNNKNNISNNKINEQVNNKKKEVYIYISMYKTLW